MKKRLYSRPLCVIISEAMFQQMEIITAKKEISLSEYVRQAIKERFDREPE